jgi:hypothetical protein
VMINQLVLQRNSRSLLKLSFTLLKYVRKRYVILIPHDKEISTLVLILPVVYWSLEDVPSD